MAIEKPIIIHWSSFIAHVLLIKSTFRGKSQRLIVQLNEQASSFCCILKIIVVYVIIIGQIYVFFQKGICLMFSKGSWPALMTPAASLASHDDPQR